jgi:hypothetical protein
MAIVPMCHTVWREGGREGGEEAGYMLSASAVVVAWLLLRERAITTLAAPAPGPVLIMGVPVLHSLSREGGYYYYHHYYYSAVFISILHTDHHTIQNSRDTGVQHMMLAPSSS